MSKETNDAYTENRTNKTNHINPLQKPNEFSEIHPKVWERILINQDSTAKHIHDELIKLNQVSQCGIETIMQTVKELQGDYEMLESFIIHRCNMIQNGKKKLLESRKARKALANKAIYYQMQLAGKTIFDELMGGIGKFNKPVIDLDT
jgi:hypothetical protein